MARFPNPQLAQQWRERLDRFDQSNLTIVQFCQLEGYSTASFYFWRRKLLHAAPEGSPGFVSVQIDSDEFHRVARHEVKIDLPCGATVNLPSDATTAERRELIIAIIQATSVEVTS